MLGAALLVLGIEGLLCLAMASPLAITLVCLGSYFGFLVHRARGNRLDTTASACALLLLPGLFGAEMALDLEAPVFEVTTRLEVAAPSTAVWQRVVDFPPITAEPEWLFRLGIAVPLSARLEGVGPGAVRYCEFSTGAFVEPIEIWDEPRLLRFGVAGNPRPLEELTLLSGPAPPHVDGFLVAKRGQFLLEPTEGGTTIVATTWYQHHLWPAAYWRLFSDHILHRIHLRVLRHVAGLAEADTAPS